MSREARDWAWRQAADRTIDDPVDLLILLNLADVADEHGGNSYPSQARLSRDCLTSDRTIRRRLGLLVDKGLLEVQARATRNRPTTYRLMLGGQNGHPTGEALGGQNGHPTGLSADNGRTLGGHSADTALRDRADEMELEIETTSPDGETKRTRARRADPAWDALVAALGWQPSTRAEKTRVGRAVREIVAALPEGTSREDVARHIEARARRYREHWPTAELTPEALVKHWSKFAPGAARPGGPASPAPQPERGTVTRPEMLRRRPPEELSYEDFRLSLAGLSAEEAEARRQMRRQGLAWKIRTETGETVDGTAWHYDEERGWRKRSNA